MADINAEIKEISRIEEAAEAGDIDWQMQLAHWYEKKARLEKENLSNPYRHFDRHADKTREQIRIIKALRAKTQYWYKKAAFQGNHEAEYMLYCLGGKEDSSLLEKAVAGGYSEALYEIGAVEEALKAAVDIDAENKILYRYGKKLFEEAKSKEEKQKGIDLLFKSSSMAKNDRAADYLLECFERGKIPFSYWFFNIFSYKQSWQDAFEAFTTKEEFFKEQNRFQKLLDMTSSVGKGFAEFYKEKYGEDFEAFVVCTDLLCFKLTIKYGSNVASVFLSAKVEEWKESFEKFLNVFTDKMRSPDEIVVAAKLCGIKWAYSPYLSNKFSIKGDEVAFFISDDLDFEIVTNIEDMKKIVVTDVVNSLYNKSGYSKYKRLSSLERIVLPKIIYGLNRFTGRWLYEKLCNSKVKSVDSLCCNIHDGFAFSADGKTLLALTDSSITDVIVPDYVEVIGDEAFKEAEIKSVYIGDNVKSLGEYAFTECHLLKSVRLPSALKEISESCFSHCDKLESIELPSSLKTIHACAFGQCSALKSIVIPDSVEQISDSVFSECENLEAVHIGSSVSKIERNTFEGCKKLKSITGMNGVKYFMRSAFENCMSLSHIDLPNKLYAFDMCVFEGCVNLSEIELPESVKHVGVNAFPETLLKLHFAGSDKQWSYMSVNNEYNRKLIKILSTAETGVLKIER